MSRVSWMRWTCVAVIALFAQPTSGQAQIFKKLKETATQAAEDELLSQADQMLKLIAEARSQYVEKGGGLQEEKNEPVRSVRKIPVQQGKTK